MRNLHTFIVSPRKNGPSRNRIFRKRKKREKDRDCESIYCHESRMSAVRSPCNACFEQTNPWAPIYDRTTFPRAVKWLRRRSDKKKKKWEKKETLGNNMRNCVSLYTLDLSRVPNIRVCMHPVWIMVIITCRLSPVVVCTHTLQRTTGAG